VTALQPVSDTQLSPANPSALQLSFTNPTRFAQAHGLQRAHSPEETTPRGRQRSEHGAPELSHVHQRTDRPTLSPRDRESSSHTSPGLGWEPTSPGPAPLLFQRRCSHRGSRHTRQDRQDFAPSRSAPSGFTPGPTAAPGTHGFTSSVHTWEKCFEPKPRPYLPAVISLL